MEKRFLAPKEIANAMINVGVGKANLKTSAMFYPSIFPEQNEMTKKIT